jgi:hypothetical protein
MNKLIKLFLGSIVVATFFYTLLLFFFMMEVATYG